MAEAVNVPLSVEESLIELLKGAGLFFLHPLFYFMMIMSLAYGYARIKRERKTFHTRIEDIYDEFKFTYSKGLLAGLVLSIVSFGLGLSLPMGMLVLIAAVSVAAALTFRQSLLSAAYTLGVSIVAGLCIEYTGFGALDAFLPQLSLANWPAAAVLLGLLLVAEGVLVYKTAHIKTSPAIVMSKRGLPIGQQIAGRTWLLPLFILIPGHAIESSVPWWPVLSFNGGFELLWIPYFIGFGQRVQGSLPIESIKITAKRISVLGIIILLVAAGSVWWTPLAALAAGAAIAGRAFLSWKQRMNDNSAPFHFSKRDQGLVVLGIIPNTPAADLGLKIGEIITKVNGISVKNAADFYEALQKNGAFFKLEVVGLNNEIRFEQRASYEGEHHELGIIFVKEEDAAMKHAEAAASQETE
ncbi:MULTISPECIES: PDZ domain-containing protein [Bacillus]|uniref:PDZ domain-containing protein n=1 Tax=Bacillus TaxID=1386 RepID=UPI0009BE8860|nr:PDZ domain-containing protein [Bacillus paralicheniformis]TWJ50672.1 Cell division topological determinant MinJ [Bacillus paralicheniformis]TWJ75065.1 Cell division topological determinant MinJ [Bacillus paralicheniformis]GIN76134.1 cell division topological determinant MinJ [Bacillus sp. J41TS8]